MLWRAFKRRVGSPCHSFLRPLGRAPEMGWPVGRAQGRPLLVSFARRACGPRPSVGQEAATPWPLTGGGEGGVLVTFCFPSQPGDAGGPPQRKSSRASLPALPCRFSLLGIAGPGAAERPPSFPANSRMTSKFSHEPPECRLDCVCGAWTDLHALPASPRPPGGRGGCVHPQTAWGGGLRAIGLVASGG